MTPRQERFAQEYLIDLNATQAATRAGYSPKTANEQGARLLANASVAAHIAAMQAERAQRMQVTQDDVVAELTRIGFSDMRQFTSWGPTGVILKASDELPEDATRCVAEVSETISAKSRSTRFKLHDKVGALTLLGKHLGTFVEKHEHTGKGGKPIEVAVKQVMKWGDTTLEF